MSDAQRRYDEAVLAASRARTELVAAQARYDEAVQREFMAWQALEAHRRDFLGRGTLPSFESAEIGMLRRSRTAR